MAPLHSISLTGSRGRIHHLGISGGKDSTALLLWARYESGYDPESLRVSFCDTGNEAEVTYAHIRLLSETVHPVETIKPLLDFWQLAQKLRRFPSARARFCTEHLKMKPTQTYVRKLVEEGYEVIMLSGVRAAKSADRARLPMHELAQASFFGCAVYRPLLYWTLDDVWAIHRRYNVPPNPLYALGCSRVGCLPCIMSRKREIAIMARTFPERIPLIRGYEQQIENPCGYASLFHRDRVPDRYRSVPVLTKPRQIKPDSKEEGEAMQLHLRELAEEVPVERERPAEMVRVATIDDVVRWALNDPDLYQDLLEEVDFGEEAPACDSRYGACE